MKNKFLLTIFAVCLCMTAITPGLRAYDDDEEEEFSPWAAWRKGFSYFEKGERNQEKGKLSEALKAYQAAYQHYYSVKKARPNWKQSVIDGRIRMCKREIDKLNKLVGTPSTTVIESTYEQDKAVSDELQRLKAEVRTLKKKLLAALMLNSELQQRTKQQKNNHKQIEDLMRGKQNFHRRI